MLISKRQTHSALATSSEMWSLVVVARRLASNCFHAAACISGVTPASSWPLMVRTTAFTGAVWRTISSTDAMTMSRSALICLSCPMMASR